MTNTNANTNDHYVRCFLWVVAPQNFVGALKNYNFLYDCIIYSQTSFNGHLSTTATKIPYIDFCLKPLYNSHLLTTPTFFCP